jgi:hypothetical protein
MEPASVKGLVNPHLPDVPKNADGERRDYVGIDEKASPVIGMEQRGVEFLHAFSCSLIRAWIPAPAYHGRHCTSD